MPYSTTNSKASLKNTILWLSLLTMFGVFISLFFTDFKPLQKEITLKIDIKNKVNICLPEDKKPIN